MKSRKNPVLFRAGFLFVDRGYGLHCHWWRDCHLCEYPRARTDATFSNADVYGSHAAAGDCGSDLGVQVRMIPADAHFQAGKIESQNYALKRILRKTIDQSQCVGPEVMKVAVIFAC